MAADECLPQGIRGMVQIYFPSSAQLVESTWALLKFVREVSPNLPWLTSSSYDLRNEGTEKMRSFERKHMAEGDCTERHCQCVDGLNPWAMTANWSPIDSEKSPQCLSLSLWMPLLFASDCQSVTDCDVEESAPAPRWPCHIPLSPTSPYTPPPPSIRPSILSCFSHQVSNVCLFTFTERLPPPLSALVATETADSGRVGGCLRALAALPHAVLSQYISASVLLLWPWYADSSGGSVRCYTIVSATQRLFVQFPQRTCSVFRVALPFMFSYSANNGSQGASSFPTDKSLVLADFFLRLYFAKFVKTLFMILTQMTWDYFASTAPGSKSHCRCLETLLRWLIM